MSDTPDIIERPAPALNTSSDAPVLPSVAPEPEAPDAVSRETQQAEPKAVEPASPPEAEGAAEPAAKEPRGVGKRLQQLEAQLREAQALADQSAAEAKLARDALARITPPVPTERPRAESYQTPAEYDEAVISWAKAEGMKEATQQRAQVAQTQAEQAILRTWEQRKAAAMETMPDWETVVTAENLPIPLPVARAIVRSEDGPQVAYYLGKNPDEAARIAKLDPEQQIYEVGRIIGERPWQRNARTVSKAPAPIAPLGGSRQRAGQVSPEDESMEAYAARRTEELRPRRAGQPLN